MQSTSVTPWQTCFYYIPNKFSSNHSLHLHNKKTLVFSSLFSHSNTHSCFQEQEKHNNNSHPDRQKHIFLQEMYSSIENEKPHNRKDDVEQEVADSSGTHKLQILDPPRVAVTTHSSIRSNSWWARIKAALGQRINMEGISFSIGIFYKHKHLAIPHVFVQDIRYIDWVELKNRGFEGVVFDKDNTITVPYSLNLWSSLASSMEQCKSLFGNNIAVFSNSAGLAEYDPDDRKAQIVERSIGIKVIRHRLKKPAGTAEEIERQFGCESSRLIMVGDRPFTDIVYGNRNGFLTILTAPLSLSQEPFIVKQVRKLEMALLNRWSRKGVKPISHRLLPDCRQCVKDELL
ncbi:phosphatidylglycerophosphate phosphatase 1, chloroplastic/mitochondrial-like [Lycium barbarum]|uniref:phosphatidylglycerophosphate phosphatase 1, chloroplastic/mitochondrial-like n=1 Tax=Lycium barbarum TaxID=112863 RepID=UPI00293E22F4|nr:phosphatidylglycerophosphate phosphatase 1, chloroplastic/mitochondrial-like [Lycium barbarum]